MNILCILTKKHFNFVCGIFLQIPNVVPPFPYIYKLTNIKNESNSSKTRALCLHSQKIHFLIKTQVFMVAANFGTKFAFTSGVQAQHNSMKADLRRLRTVPNIVFRNHTSDQSSVVIRTFYYSIYLLANCIKTFQS